MCFKKQILLGGVMAVACMRWLLASCAVWFGKLLSTPGYKNKPQLPGQLGLACCWTTRACIFPCYWTVFPQAALQLCVWNFKKSWIYPSIPRFSSWPSRDTITRPGVKFSPESSLHHALVLIKWAKWLRSSLKVASTILKIGIHFPLLQTITGAYWLPRITVPWHIPWKTKWSVSQVRHLR